MINDRDDVNSLHDIEDGDSVAYTVCIRPFILDLKWINNNEVT